VELKVLDQIPVSEDDRLRVEILQPRRVEAEWGVGGCRCRGDEG
jgi:hypothetical protein